MIGLYLSAIDPVETARAVGLLAGGAVSDGIIEQVQQALGVARANWFVWWLRANGRYLIPRGARDATFVGAIRQRAALKTDGPDLN